MKNIASIALIITAYLCTPAYADSTNDFLQKLKTPNINGIDAALIRLELFSEQENKQLSNNKTQLKFIYTYNRLEMSAFIKKPKSGMTINECLDYLNRIKSDYSNTRLSDIAFSKYPSGDKKTAENLFAYQVLLVDENQSNLVVSCR